MVVTTASKPPRPGGGDGFTGRRSKKERGVSFFARSSRSIIEHREETRVKPEKMTSMPQINASRGFLRTTVEQGNTGEDPVETAVTISEDSRDELCTSTFIENDHTTTPRQVQINNQHQVIKRADTDDESSMGGSLPEETRPARGGLSFRTLVRFNTPSLKKGRRGSAKGQELNVVDEDNARYSDGYTKPKKEMSSVKSDMRVSEIEEKLDQFSRDIQDLQQYFTSNYSDDIGRESNSDKQKIQSSDRDFVTVSSSIGAPSPIQQMTTISTKGAGDMTPSPYGSNGYQTNSADLNDLYRRLELIEEEKKRLDDQRTWAVAERDTAMGKAAGAETRLREVTNELTATKKALTEAQGQVNELQKQKELGSKAATRDLQGAQASMEQSKREVKELQARSIALSKKLESLTKEKEQLSQTTAEASRAVRKVEEEKDLIVMENRSMLRKMGETMAERDEAKLMSANMEKDLTALRKTASKMKTHIKKINSEKTRNATLLAAAQAQLINRDEALGKHEKDKSELEERSVAVENSLQSKEKELSELAAQNRELTEGKRSLEEAGVKDRALATEKIGMLSAERLQLREELHKKESALEEEREELEAEAEILRIELKLANEERDDAVAKVEIAAADAESFKAMHQKAEDELDQVLEQLEETERKAAHLETIEAANNRLKAEVDSMREVAVGASLLEAEAAQKQKTIDGLRKEMQEHEKKLKLVDALRLEIEELQIEGDDMDRVVQELRKKCTDLESENRSLRSDRDQTDLENELKVLRTKCATLEADNDELRRSGVVTTASRSINAGPAVAATAGAAMGEMETKEDQTPLLVALLFMILVALGLGLLLPKERRRTITPPGRVLSHATESFVTGRVQTPASEQFY